MTHVAYIYGYFFEGRCRYVGQARNVERRHQGHLKGESGFETFLQLIYSYNPIRPVILETVTGTDHKDLVFNLAWAEAVLMFKHHTYRPVFGNQGLNYTLPFGPDYRGMAINGGRRTHELHPEQASIIGKKGGLIGGRKGGLIGGRIAIERWAGTPEQKEWSSRGGRDQPREAKVCGGRIGGRIGGPIGSRNQPREAKVCGGRIGGPIGSRITNHLRWHIPYGVYSPTCDLCTNQP